MCNAALPSGLKTSASSVIRSDMGKKPLADFSITLRAGILSSASLKILPIESSVSHEPPSHDSAFDCSQIAIRGKLVRSLACARGDEVSHKPRSLTNLLF